MSPQEFKRRWIDVKYPLSPISAERVRRFSLLDRTRDFLTIAGLPEYTECFLSFAKDLDDLTFGIVKLTEAYPFLDDEPGFDQYVVIGSCRDGDAIVVDTSQQDVILELDHEDMFRPMFFNSSIEAMADFLILSRDFEASVLAEHGEEKRRKGYFTDAQFEQLRNGMLAVDERALVEDGFWKEELKIMLSHRQDHVNGIDRYSGIVKGC